MKLAIPQIAARIHRDEAAVAHRIQGLGLQPVGSIRRCGNRREVPVYDQRAIYQLEDDFRRHPIAPSISMIPEQKEPEPDPDPIEKASPSEGWPTIT
jgi:hypothetical protein